ncbi:retrograde regulation protein 2 [Xylogone sp. PMI_703]|nr:retrograde regulation protein 2 [Xylogone sp. PMI_703]
MGNSSIDEKSTTDHVEEVLGGLSAEEVREFEKQEARVRKKIDLYLAPVLGILLLLSFLDRGNIGFAATQGMIRDLGLERRQLNISISIFYVFYILAEIPCSLIVKRLQFDRVISGATLLWGAVCLGTGFVKTFPVLVVCRLLLGLFEGFLFPSLVLMMANWYKREELGVRLSYLYTAIALSSAFGGLIAFAILGMDGARGYPGWRWLYIIEGACTIVVAALCYFLIPKDYASAYFLTDEDKKIMRRRHELMESYNGGDGHYSKNDFLMALGDIKTWVHGVVQGTTMTVVYGFGVFLPIILQSGFHFTTKQVQYLGIPAFIWGAIVYTSAAIVADRYQKRFLILLASFPTGIAGFAILLAPAHTVSVGVRYFSCFLITTTMFVGAGGNMTWLSVNSAPDGKRAASVGITLTISNIGGIVSGQIYATQQAPAFRLGHAWCLGCYVVSVIGCIILKIIYTKRQTEKDRVLEQGNTSTSLIMSDLTPTYKYQI